MITPGKETLELLLNNPYLYLFWIYFIPLFLSGISAYFADRAADAKLKEQVKVANPQADQAMLDNTFQFENITDPIVWGIMACIVIVFPMVQVLDSIGDWGTVWAAAILAGLVSYSALTKLAANFIMKVTEKSP